MKKKPQIGFTIVELLIVIVVIGLLAVIVVSAFRSAQNNANDASVKTDLKNLAKIISNYAVDNASLPSAGSDASLSAFRFTSSRTGYDISSTNLLYCRGTNGRDYGLAGRSISGTMYAYRNNSFVDSYTPPDIWTNFSATCADLAGSGATARWGYTQTDTWRSWTATP